ncbi:MAG: hypothetical protein AAFR77_20385 [Cyanobacteria bacterium J06631_2]
MSVSETKLMCQKVSTTKIKAIARYLRSPVNFRLRRTLTRNFA